MTVNRIAIPILALLLIPHPGPTPVSAAAAEAPRGRQLFYRMLGARSNAPLLPKTRSICARDDGDTTGQTGMADSGFTEYPFCAGRTTYTFMEDYAYFPRLASAAEIDPARINTGDILIDHVYEPVPIVWGLRGREFVQTFVATGRELATLTLLVPSEAGQFRAALLENGPGGRQIGAAKSFRSGHSMEWGHVRWLPGEAPLDPGRSYGIRIWREDGEPWSPFLHATGNCYDDGCLHVDGRPRPESDLGAWIIEEPPELSRALIEGADSEGTVYASPGVVFIPRTPNVRLITITASPVPMKCGDLFLSVWTDEAKPRRLAGPKRCLGCGPENGPHTSHFLFGPNELPVEPGRRYRAGVVGWVEHRAAAPNTMASAEAKVLDLKATVYGDTHPGALPALYNLTAHFPTNTVLSLSWGISFPCPVQVTIDRVRSSDHRLFDLAPGSTELEIPNMWPGHEYDFRLEAIGREGLTWRTPLYRVQVTSGPHPIVPRLYPEQPDVFVPLAPPPALEPPRYGPLRYREEVSVANYDFEDGLSGWTTSPPGVIYATGEEHGIAPRSGKMMAGWSHLSATSREQVFQESTLYQTIPTRPGHTYLLSVRLHTSVANAPRGDTRVRLFADPTGGTECEGPNATQWFWTDGRWMRFQHRWVARTERSTIGCGFFRWRDLERSSAYVDRVMVFDLGPAPAAPLDPPAPATEPPTVVLNDQRIEFDERVEADLSAPPGFVITGLGSRAHEDNITTLWLQVRPLHPDGTLGPAEQLRAGWEPDANLEAQIQLPEGHVATGFGARIAPEWDVKTLAVWARPLKPGGELGEEKVFRAGNEPDGGLERQVRLPPGRVLVTAGLNCGFNDVNRIKSASMALGPTRTARGAGQAQQ